MASSNTTTTTTTTTRTCTTTVTSPKPTSTSTRPSQFIQHQHQPHQTLTQASSDPINIIYPLASSGRGLRGMRPQLQQFSMPMPKPNAPPPPPPPRRPITPLFSAPQSQHQHQHQQQLRAFAPSNSHSNFPLRSPYLHPAISPSPHPKAASLPTSTPNYNARKDLIDKGREDAYVTVRDRKVKISDGLSIYALCRSWLRNGYSEESQLQYDDIMKSLPKPSPMPTSETSSPKRKESVDETETEEVEKSVENLYPRELLQRHIKRAKRVRARLREERLQRIERYKGRLALLLPPLLEQCRNDTTSGA